MERWTMTAAQRRATGEALKIARKVDSGRPVLRSLQVTDGRAFVTDSFVAVRLEWFDGLPDGPWDADAMYEALKGAGKDRARITVDDGSERLTVERINGDAPFAVNLEDDLGSLSRGTFVVPRIEGTPPNIGSIWDEAVERIESDDYEPELAPFDPDRLGSILKAHPGAFEHGDHPVKLHPCGLKPTVVSNGQPYALIMPMRVS